MTLSASLLRSQLVTHNLLVQDSAGFAIFLLRASLLRWIPRTSLIVAGDMWGCFNGVPTHFSLNNLLFVAYAMPVMHDQPLRHRKR